MPKCVLPRSSQLVSDVSSSAPCLGAGASLGPVGAGALRGRGRRGAAAGPRCARRYSPRGMIITAPRGGTGSGPQPRAALGGSRLTARQAPRRRATSPATSFARLWQQPPANLARATMRGALPARLHKCLLCTSAGRLPCRAWRAGRVAPAGKVPPYHYLGFSPRTAGSSPARTACATCRAVDEGAPPARPGRASAREQLVRVSREAVSAAAKLPRD